MKSLSFIVGSIVAQQHQIAFPCGLFDALAIAATSQLRRTTATAMGAVCAFSLVASTNAAQYMLTDLGTLGGTDSLAWSINSSGQVAGYATIAGDTEVRGFLWNPTTPNSPTGMIYDLGTLGGTFGWATGINDAGQVVGVSSTDEDEADHATLWNPTTPNGSSGTLYDLQTLGGLHSQANAANAAGQVTGASETDDEGVAHAFIWNPDAPNGATGTMHDIGSLGGSFAMGWDVNANGSVTGESDVLEDAATRAFLWKPTVAGGVTGVMHDLGTLGGTDSGGSGINAAGQVAGWSAVTDDEAAHAFLWTPNAPGDVVGEMLDLGTLGGSDSYAYAVNAAGEVVGFSYVPPEVSNYGHAFLYTSAGGMVDLNDLIDPQLDWELLDADDINSAGQIVGQGLVNDEYHAFLLTPIPAIPGDFNGDHLVDADDLEQWKGDFGVNDHSDADDDGDSDGADFLIWQRQLGQGAATRDLATAVPEPATIALLAIGLCVMASLKRGAPPLHVAALEMLGQQFGSSAM